MLPEVPPAAANYFLARGCPIKYSYDRNPDIREIRHCKGYDFFHEIILNMRQLLAVRVILNILIVCGVCGIPECGAQPADSTAVYLFPNETPVTFLALWKTRRGDDSAWRSPGFDDSRWTAEAVGTLWARDKAPGTGVQWYRKTIFFPEPLDSLRPCGLFCRAAVCASELYWDGVLISQNGRIAMGNSPEAPGVSAAFAIVPRYLATPGRHTVALRVGNAKTFSGLVETPLQIGYFDELLGGMRRSQTLLILCAGVFLITALFHFAVILGRARGPAYALFAVLCLSSAVYLLIDVAVSYFPTNLAHYYAIALVNDIPWFLMMALLPVFFLYEFAHPLRHKLSAAIAAVALACIVPPRLIMFGLLPVGWLPVFDVANRFLMYAVTLFSAVIAFINVLRRNKGAVLALSGCIALFAGIYVSFQRRTDYAWALGFCALIVLLTLSLSRQMAEQNRRRQESELRSARLELELLKKHIQPHFLLNSLNSIVAWLEENPANAVRLVNALAEELRLMIQFSKEKLVPVNEELRLCGLHLEVMGLRHDRAYVLEAETAPEAERVPPLVLHTLVENGLTHGCKDGRGKFVFRRKTDGARVTYIIFNDGVGDAAVVPGPEGTGVRYVKTRLEEAFPGAWKFSGGPVPGGWEARMEIVQGAA